MATMTIRIPDDTHTRIKNLARQRGMSVNRLMEELSVIAVTQHDAQARFRALAARGSARAGLAILEKLDREFATDRSANRRRETPT